MTTQKGTFNFCGVHACDQLRVHFSAPSPIRKGEAYLPIHSSIKCRPPPLLLVFIMAAAELRDTDLEGQTAGTSHEFSYEQELSRVKSAGGVTISPELFERVGFAIL